MANVSTNSATQPRPDMAWHTLAEFALPDQPGSDRQVRTQVTEAVRHLNIPAAYLERLKTAISEAMLNVTEYGNHYRPDAPVIIRVLVSGPVLPVRATDQNSSCPFREPEPPDLAAKPAGQQPQRGWGFFLIEKMMDNLRVTSEDTHCTIELFLYWEGCPDGLKLAYP